MSAGDRLGESFSDTWLHPSPRLGTLRRIEVAAGALVLVLATGLPLLLSGHPILAGTAVLALLVLALLADVLLQRRVRAWSFCERHDDLLVRRGLLFARLSLVPYGRMQFIDVSRGPFERALGLATVRLHTASAVSDARIPGLPLGEAERLRDQLSALGNAQAAGL